ncbi:MAG: DUF91 domain-containing protein [Lachnospiraceae bacterium]|nr:DUF91 domain-containing protein [Lachnospiraceae bacterium]
MKYVKTIDEHLIRDKLCNNLYKIEDGLVLCEKECYLKAPAYGTRGFIDILAKDRYGCAVVIELKTRRSTTREAIHELIKYSEYLQMQFGMSPSEIRLMLVATDWTELLIPFSSFYAQSYMNLEGYQIFINDENDIKKIEKIQQVEVSSGRIFSDCMLFLWCRNEKTVEKMCSFVKNYYKKREYGSYIVLKLKAPENFEVNEKKAMSQMEQNLGISISVDEYQSPLYFLCIATKSHSQDELLIMIKDSYEIQRIIVKEGYETAEEVPLFYLHNKALYHDIWDFGMNWSYIEIGEPAKLSAYINESGWKIEELIRGSVYEQNHFLSNETIKKELLGNETTDRRKVCLKFKTDNRSSVHHAQQILKQYLECNSYWRIPLLQVLEDVENQQIQTSDGCIKYVDQMSILKYLYLYSIDKTPDSLLPRTILLYRTFDSIEKKIEQIKYLCIYEKTHKSLPFSKIIEKYYDNSIAHLRIGAMFDGYREDNLEIAYDMGFECTVYKEIILNYFPVHLDGNNYQILHYCNEPPIYKKYDFLRDSYIECSIDSDILQHSYEQFIQEETEFMKELSLALKNSENGLFYI